VIPIYGTLGHYLDRLDHWFIVMLAWTFTFIVVLYNIIMPRIRAKKLRKKIANSPNPRQTPLSDVTLTDINQNGTTS